MKKDWIVKALISLTAMVAALIHKNYVILSNDEVTWILLAIAALPWLQAVIEEVTGPAGWKIRFRTIEQQQGKMMEMLITFSMSGFIYGRLQNIYFSKRGHRADTFDGAEDSRQHLRFLYEHGYIHFIDVNNLVKGDNLAEKVTLTPAGEAYVRIREQKELEG